MEILNYLFPFNDFILPLTLNKVSGKESIQLDSGKDLYEYLKSPADTVFMRVESDSYEKFNIFWGDVVIIERTPLVPGALAAIKRENEIILRELNKDLKYPKYFGTITYVLQSEEEDFLDMVGQDLFIVT